MASTLRFKRFNNQKKHLNANLEQEIERVSAQLRHKNGQSSLKNIQQSFGENQGDHSYHHEKLGNRHCRICLQNEDMTFGVPRGWEENLRAQRLAERKQKEKLADDTSYLDEALRHLTHELVLEELESLRLLRLLRK